MVLSSRTAFSEEPVQLFADLLVRTAEGVRIVDARRLVVEARAPVDRVGHCTHVRTEVQLVAPRRDDRSMTDAEVIAEAHGSGFELIERMSAGQWAVGSARGDDDSGRALRGTPGFEPDAGSFESRARVLLSGWSTPDRQSWRSASSSHRS